MGAGTGSDTRTAPTTRLTRDGFGTGAKLSVTYTTRRATFEPRRARGQPTAAHLAIAGFACVLSQIDEVRTACGQRLPGCTSDPHSLPWNGLELHVITPSTAC